jgi:hypothetical protein
MLKITMDEPYSPCSQGGFMGKNLIKYAAFLAALALLSGCPKHGSEDKSNDPPPAPAEPVDMPPDDAANGPEPVFYQFNPDYTTPGGMDIDLNGNSPDPIEGSTDPEYIEGVDVWYEEAQQCVADWYAILYPDQEFQFSEPPPVVIADDPESICGDFDGFINGIYCANFAIPIMVIRGGATYQSSGVWKHETIHHVLFMNDFDQTMNLNHKPDEIWSNCVL